MSPEWIKIISTSKDAALVLSLLFNGLACAAIWRMWRAHAGLQDKVTGMLTELVSELMQLTKKEH